MESRITEAELAERLTEVIDRVLKGEQFVVVREGEAVAVLGPTHPSLSTAVQEVADRLKSIAIPGNGSKDAPEPAAP
jgi:antitoxin (DNA-binding transcriptional repressor) of toxin-antitoxin stability system